MIRAALLVLAFATPAIAQPKPEKPPVKPVISSALQLLTEVEDNYKKPQHLLATFDQTIFNPVTGLTQPAIGTFRVEKPNKLRFDFLQPKRKDPKPKVTYVFDGKVLWAIDYGNKQVAQKSAEGNELPSMVTFFLGAGTLSRDFNVASATTADATLVPADATGLVLTPKKPSAAYAKIVLVIDAKRMVTQTSIVNSSGVVQTMKFTGIALDKPAPADTFVLDRKAYAGWSFIKP